MLILDACRNNPFERRFRSVGGGLAQINAPEGTLIAYATSPGKVAADGEGANGLYTQELLKALGQPGMKAEDVFKMVRVGVTRASNGAQVPWEASSLTGDFFFVESAAPAPSQRQSPAGGIVDREAMFWEAIKATGDPSELRAYLETYPNGSFSALARARIAGFESRNTTSPANPRGAALSPPTVEQSTFQLMSQIPSGVIQTSRLSAYLIVSDGVARFNTQYGYSGGRSTDPGQCSGIAQVGPEGEIRDVRINCAAPNAPSIALRLSGKLVDTPNGKQFQGSLTDMKKQSFETTFR